MNIDPAIILSVISALALALVAVWRLDRGALVKRIKKLEERAEVHEQTVPLAKIVGLCPRYDECPLSEAGDESRKLFSSLVAVLLLCCLSSCAHHGPALPVHYDKSVLITMKSDASDKSVLGALATLGTALLNLATKVIPIPPL